MENNLFFTIKHSHLLTNHFLNSNFIVEPKLNGWHTLWVKTSEDLKIYTRNLKEITKWKGLEKFHILFSNFKPGFYLAELLAETEIGTDVERFKKKEFGKPIFFDYVE